jgi:hypothetical protein
MKKSIVPSAAELAREALIVLGGTLLAALVVGQLPALKAWLQAQWKTEP